MHRTRAVAIVLAVAATGSLAAGATPGSAGTDAAAVNLQQARAVAAAAQGKAPGKPTAGPAMGSMRGMDGRSAAAAAGPAQDPSVGGSWSTLAQHTPTEAIHSVLLRNGKILLIAGSGNNYDQFAAGTFRSSVWDPVKNTYTVIPTPYDMFCAGHVQLPDGRILVAGGTVSYPEYDSAGNLTKNWTGSKKSYIFDPATNTYSATGDMSAGRWYPTLLELGNGDVLGVAGLDENANDNTGVSEMFTRTAGGGTWAVRPGNQPLPQYPDLVLMADGRVFYSGESTGDSGKSPGIWDLADNSYREVPGLGTPYQRNAGATVLLPPAQKQRVMVMGGGDYQLPSVGDTAIVDLTSANPAYVAGPPMDHTKMYVGAVLLPDRTVLQTNGGNAYRKDPVYDAQIYNPTTNTWRTVNSPSVGRLYHSSAFLLPDGRVATVGSQALDGTFEMRTQIYKPTYLFRGTRPKLTSGPAALAYGATGSFGFTKASGATIKSVSLLRPSATTHSTDVEQRLIDVPFTSSNGVAKVTVPSNPNLTPPGWYMLTLLDSKNRPSPARWVHIG